MDFKKKFNHDDINNYLPDNTTLATSEYFQNKFVGLPSYVCDILEVKSRVEYNEKSEIEFLNIIKEKKRLEDEKLMAEYDERAKESITPLQNELDELDSFKTIKLDDAK
jgi:hypothetical protein